MKKVGVTKEEQALSYYKYFTRPLAEVPEEKLALLESGASPVPAVSFDHKELFISGKDDDYCQVGYGIMDDGTGFVANKTYMPGVTSAMLDWWFPWHSVGSDLRYKIWDNEDHYFARADNVSYVCDPKVPMHQKTWGVSHYILEDVGNGPDYLKLNFKSPVDFGYEINHRHEALCDGMVCAIGESTVAAAMTHKWYPYGEGVMFVSRFWIGFGVVNNQIVKTLPEGVCLPVEIPKGLYAHNIKEFTHLASILPEVYAENKDNF